MSSVIKKNVSNLRHFSDVKEKREQLHFQIKGDDCRTITATLSRTGKRWAVTYHIQRALKCWWGAVPSFEWIFYSNADNHTIEAVITLITPGGSLFRQFHQICHQNPERGCQSFSRLNKYQPPPLTTRDSVRVAVLSVALMTQTTAKHLLAEYPQNLWGDASGHWLNISNMLLLQNLVGTCSKYRSLVETDRIKYTSTKLANLHYSTRPFYHLDQS